MWHVSQEMDYVHKSSSVNEADWFGYLYSSAYGADLRPTQIHAPKFILCDESMWPVN
jgi:hypothetical protein